MRHNSISLSTSSNTILKEKFILEFCKATLRVPLCPAHLFRLPLMNLSMNPAEKRVNQQVLVGTLRQNFEAAKRRCSRRDWSFFTQSHRSAVVITVVALPIKYCWSLFCSLLLSLLFLKANQSLR